MPRKKRPSLIVSAPKKDPLPSLQPTPRPSCSCETDHLAKIQALEFTVKNDNMIIDHLKTLEAKMNLHHFHTIADFENKLKRCKEREDHYEDELRAMSNQLAEQHADFSKKTEFLTSENKQLIQVKNDKEKRLQEVQALKKTVDNQKSTIKELEAASVTQEKEIEELRSHLNASFVCHSKEIREKLKRLKDVEDISSCKICYSEYDSEGHYSVCLVPCGHVFGSKCVEQILRFKQLCPICHQQASHQSIQRIYLF